MIGNCYTKSYQLDLPSGTPFVYRNWNNFITGEYGPRIINFLVSDCIWTSQDFAIVGNVSAGLYELYGAITARKSFTYFLVHSNQGQLASISVLQPEIGITDEPEEIITLRGKDWRDLLIEYAPAAAAKANFDGIQPKTNITGYCSWYYYYFTPNESQFIQALSSISQKRDLYPARYAQIDDGYQIAYGDWLLRNSSWPTPLKEIATQIKDMGFEAGIWTMPFLADTQSKVFQNHPDWFVKNSDGQFWHVQGWGLPAHDTWVCLDLSRNDVQSHLRNVYETFYDWGFHYFKLDGGGFSSPIGRRACSEATGVSCLRTGLKIIREAVKDSVVLGCAIPYLPSIGLVDHTRVSTDTGECWRMMPMSAEKIQSSDNSQPFPPSTPGLENALKGTLANWWMYDRWFRCDPDVIIARDENSHLTHGEARMSALSGILTGVSITSDQIEKMHVDRIKLLSKAASIRMKNVIPLDWKEQPWPNIYKGTVDGREAIAIFNFSDFKRVWKISDFKLPGVSEEILHPMGVLDDIIELCGHDSAMIVSI